MQVCWYCVHFSSGTLCGHVPPQDLVSDGNTLYFSFSSNDKVVDAGFTASWKAVDPSEGKIGAKFKKKKDRQQPSDLLLSYVCCYSLFPLANTHTHTHIPAPCGGSFSTNQGELMSPNWPSDYQAQSVCTWRIDIPSAGSIHVAFTHFEMQAVDILGNCVDYVEVFDGKNMSSLGW